MVHILNCVFGVSRKCIRELSCELSYYVQLGPYSENIANYYATFLEHFGKYSYAETYSAYYPAPVNIGEQFVDLQLSLRNSWH